MKSVAEQMDVLIRQRVDLTQEEIEAVVLCAIHDIRGAREELRVLVREALAARGYITERSKQHGKAA